MEEKMYSVSEAVRLIGVESHVLRYWEEELQVKIERTSQGHRIYSRQNIETFQQAKSLKEKGIQLKAIRVLLEETGKPEEEQGEEERHFLEQIREIDSGEQVSKAADRMEGSDSEYRKKLEELLGRNGTGIGPEATDSGQESGFAETENESGKRESEPEDTFCEIILPEPKTDQLKQFEAILRRMMEEVVEEQNEKLEKAIASMIREEIEELWLQYYQVPMEEAAAASERRREGKLKGLLGRYFGGRFR